MCPGYSYLTLDFVDQQVNSLQNNVTQISRVTIHVRVEDMHTFLPRSFQIMLYIYDDHEA